MLHGEREENEGEIAMRRDTSENKQFDGKRDREEGKTSTRRETHARNKLKFSRPG
jgi:hypothetical protein